MKKLLLLLLLCVFVLSCSENKETEAETEAETEVQLIAATEYGIYVKNIDSEYRYRFYNYNTGETYREGVTSNPTLLFPVTSKERENTHVVVDVFSDDENIEYFTISKNGNLYLNDKDNPDATKIQELNPFFDLDNGSYQGVIPIDDTRFTSWIDSRDYSNN